MSQPWSKTMKNKYLYLLESDEELESFKIKNKNII